MIFKSIFISYFYYIIIIISFYIVSFNIHEIESSHIEIHPQSIQDPEYDWSRLADGRENRNGDSANDIKELFYFKIEETIYATLWLQNLTSLDKNPNTLQYGVQIDADSNRRTGDRGIEYDLIVTWDSKMEKWKKEYIQRSSFGDTIILHEEYVNMSKFRKGNTVNINMNMSHFNLPDKYKLFFYAIGKKYEQGTPWTIDFLRWIYFPPPEFNLALKPDKIDQISYNETKRIQVITSSSIDLPAKVEIGVNEESQTESNLFDLKLINNDEINIIPQYGKHKTDLDIELLKDTMGSTSIIVEANFTLSNESYSAHFKTQENNFFPIFPILSSPNTQSVELPIIMKKSPDLVERVVISLEGINRIIGPLQATLTGVSSIVGIIIGTIFSDKIKKIIFNDNLKTGVNKMKTRVKNKSKLKKENNTEKSMNKDDSSLS